MAKPITREAITAMCSETHPRTIAIADLGCSSGPNTFLEVAEFIKQVESEYRKRGFGSPEYQVYLNDLPGNDFNLIFESLPGFLSQLKELTGVDSKACFVNGVAGSFYGRLFPRQSLHLVHSSSSLHWLSEVPKGLEGNEWNICLASTSPRNVFESFYMQFQKDFALFLRCRSEEIVTGGRMVLTFHGKSTEPFSRDSHRIWELMAIPLREMVHKGVIKKEMMESFNIPYYAPSLDEVQREVEKEGSFRIDRLVVSQQNWNMLDDDNQNPSNEKDAHNLAMTIRAVAEPILVNQFGPGIIDQVFQRFREILIDSTSNESISYFNVTLSVTRK